MKLFETERTRNHHKGMIVTTIDQKTWHREKTRSGREFWTSEAGMVASRLSYTQQTNKQQINTSTHKKRNGSNITKTLNCASDWYSCCTQICASLLIDWYSCCSEKARQMKQILQRKARWSVPEKWRRLGEQEARERSRGWIDRYCKIDG